MKHDKRTQDMDMQAFIDNMNAANSATRSGYHLTLGALQEALLEAPARHIVVFDDGTPAGGFDSYRGYYIDIAINDDAAPRSVMEWRDAASRALKTTFVGYKGGEYPATPEKPLWRAEYGEAPDVAIIGYDYSGDTFKLLTRQL